MKMDLTPEQTLVGAVLQAQSDIADLKANQLELREFILGNGDPKKGLMWLAANQGELLTTLAGLVTAQGETIRLHITAHAAPPTVWQRLGYEALRQVMIICIITIMGLIVIGTVAYFRTWPL